MDTGYDSDNEQYEEAYGDFCTSESRSNSPAKTFETNTVPDYDCDSINGIPPSDLKFSKGLYQSVINNLFIVVLAGKNNKNYET